MSAGTSLRVCACGCGAELRGMRPDARYASDTCRAKAHREKAERDRAEAYGTARAAAEAYVAEHVKALLPGEEFAVARASLLGTFRTGFEMGWLA